MYANVIVIDGKWGEVGKMKIRKRYQRVTIVDKYVISKLSRCNYFALIQNALSCAAFFEVVI
jgi:hypothetical protein